MASFEELFKLGEEDANKTGKNNMVFAVLNSLISDSPAPLLQHVQAQQQINAKKGFAKQFLNTPDFQNVSDSYKGLAARYAGQGDIENTYQMIKAGTKAKEEADLQSAAEQFQKTGDSRAYEQVLLKQNPTAWATLQKSTRAEKNQVLNNLNQQLGIQKQEAKAQEVPQVTETEKLMKSVIAQNPSAADLSLDVDEFAARFGLTKPQAMQVKSGLEKAQSDLGVRATEPGFLRGLGERFGLLDKPTQLSPKAGLEAAQSALISPEALAQNEEAKAEQERIRRMQEQVQAEQAQNVFLSKPRSTAPVSKAQKEAAATVRVQRPDGAIGRIPAKNLQAFLKAHKGAKVLGE